jgi:hypothetical protein
MLPEIYMTFGQVSRSHDKLGWLKRGRYWLFWWRRRRSIRNLREWRWRWKDLRLRRHRCGSRFLIRACSHVELSRFVSANPCKTQFAILFDMLNQ